MLVLVLLFVMLDDPFHVLTETDIIRKVQEWDKLQKTTSTQIEPKSYLITHREEFLQLIENVAPDFNETRKQISRKKYQMAD